MRQGSLMERLQRSKAEARDVLIASETDATSSVLRDVARALQDVTRPAAKKPDVAPAKGVKAPADDSQRKGEETGTSLTPVAEAMPLLLTTRSTTRLGAGDLPASRRSDPGHLGNSRQLLAPALLAVAVVAIGVLMAAPATELAHLPGFQWLASAPRPKLARIEPVELSPLAHTALPQPAAAVAAIDAEELALLERCESMIARGEMTAARAELARAASSGSAQARFALAETFDPNVLAAWGLRENVADTGVARAFYTQALAAGDQRAKPRLAALDETR